MDPSGIVRGALAGYLGLLGLLLVATLSWGALRVDPGIQWLAAGWFAAAGAGRLLLSAMLVRYRRRNGGIL